MAMNRIARRSKLLSQRNVAHICLHITASRDPFSEYQSPAIGGSAVKQGKARERPGQEINGDELAEAFRHDLHGEMAFLYLEAAFLELNISIVIAKMMTSPMRRCAVTGARLPRGSSSLPIPYSGLALIPSLDSLTQTS
jgi:hypothetical protein